MGTKLEFAEILPVRDMGFDYDDKVEALHAIGDYMNDYDFGLSDFDDIDGDAPKTMIGLPTRHMGVALYEEENDGSLVRTGGRGWFRSMMGVVDWVYDVAHAKVGGIDIVVRNDGQACLTVRAVIENPMVKDRSQLRDRFYSAGTSQEYRDFCREISEDDEEDTY